MEFFLTFVTGIAVGWLYHRLRLSCVGSEIAQIAEAGGKPHSLRKTSILGPMLFIMESYSSDTNKTTQTVLKI